MLGFINDNSIQLRRWIILEKPLTEKEISEKIGNVSIIERTSWIGEDIGNISLYSTSGKIINLLEKSQKNNIILFFYPGNGRGLEYPELMGCTFEAAFVCNSLKSFEELNTKIYGISTQSTEEQSIFSKNQRLNFELLSDAKGELLSDLGVSSWKSKKNEIFAARETVFIKEGGKIALHIKNISFEQIENHVSDILSQIATLLA